ncbi:hypothetical protein D6764_04805 [Candidatus Woesearchaeota archaeon]|nr:MAG: hypothetical protein D6764_04805 [Candidatus Woesearchaeota archaeon]
MGISDLMGKLHHKDDAGGSPATAAPTPPPTPNVPPPKPVPVPAPPAPGEKKDAPQHDSKPAPRRWGSREVTSMRDDFDGIILDIGEGMSINIPIKRRMSLEDFLRIAERVKRLEELNMGQPSYNEHMGEYH